MLFIQKKQKSSLSIFIRLCKWQIRGKPVHVFVRRKVTWGKLHVGDWLKLKSTALKDEAHYKDSSRSRMCCGCKEKASKLTLISLYLKIRIEIRDFVWYLNNHNALMFVSGAISKPEVIWINQRQFECHQSISL